MVAVLPLGGAIGVRHRGYPGRHARLKACPSQCLQVHRWVAVGSVVRCWAGGGLIVVVAPCSQRPVAIHRHWGGRQATHSAHTPHHSLQSGLGLRTLGPWASSGVTGREPHKVDLRNGGDPLGPQEGVQPVPLLRRREGGRRHGRCPVEVG